MSIANITIERDRALIAFDTKGGLMQIPAAQQFKDAPLAATKAYFLPHANTVMATLGDAMFATYVYMNLALSLAPDFDHLVEVMPQVFGNAYTATLQSRKLLFGVDVPFPGSALMLVGWSKAIARMTCVRWSRWPGDKVFTPTHIGESSINPEIEVMPDVPHDAGAMATVARAQVESMRRRFPKGEYVVGGNLLLTELTRDTCTTRVIADLEAA